MQLLAAEKAKALTSELKTISVSTEVPREEIEKAVEKLLAGDLRQSLLKIGANFLPSADQARKLLDELRRTAPFVSLIAVSLVRADGLPDARIGPLDEDPEGRLQHQIAQTIEMLQPLLGVVLERMRE